MLVILGEFMQLSTKESDAEQFQDYLDKTFCKTASLFANTCKAVSELDCRQIKLFSRLFIGCIGRIIRQLSRYRCSSNSRSRL